MFQFPDVPSRSGLTISAPMSNPPEMLLTPNSVPIQGPPSIPSQSYSVQEGFQPKIQTDPQYFLPENIMQYSNDGTNFNPPNYPYSNPPPPQQPPPNYQANYPGPVQNYHQGQGYASDYQSYPNYARQHQQQQPENPPPDYPSMPSQHADNFQRAQQPPPPQPTQDSYVLTQLTDSSKSNYPVQTFPLSESTFHQPDYHRIFPDATNVIQSEPSGIQQEKEQVPGNDENVREDPSVQEKADAEKDLLGQNH